MERSIKILFLLFFVLCIGIGNSLSVHAANNTITSIEIEGNAKVDDSTILQAIRTSIGSPYSLETIHEDLKSIYNLGLFQDVEVEKGEKSGGVQITFRVK